MEKKKRGGIFERTLKQIIIELNDFVDLESTLKTILNHFKKLTDCEAISFRLYDDGDYPYYVYKGFPRSFIQHENSLNVRDEKGEKALDKYGNYMLDCLCGKIIKGDIMLSSTNFTKKGSFWTNDVSTVHDNVANMMSRKHCSFSGYKSIALIPLKDDIETVGLIQLNDKRKNIFSAEIIENLELIAGKIGTAISRSIIYDKHFLNLYGNSLKNV